MDTLAESSVFIGDLPVDTGAISVLLLKITSVGKDNSLILEFRNRKHIEKTASHSTWTFGVI